MKKLWIFYILLIPLIIYGQQSQKETDSLRIIIQSLQKRLQRVEQQMEENELEKLKQEAEMETKGEQEILKIKQFKGGQRALQAINPELSITGDMYGLYLPRSPHFTEESRSGAHFRVLGIHWQSNLDPFSLMKAVVEVSPDGVELGEAYMIWTNPLPRISIMVGKFRQQFGVVNRWHEHGLDQFSFPLALQTILGEEGLNDIGIHVDYLMPTILPGVTNLLTLEITNGQNDHLFNHQTFHFPATLLHLKNYTDLSRNSYIELGMTGMIGENHFDGYDNNGMLIHEARRYTYLGGLDLTFLWEPVNQAHYHSFIWRTEFYYAKKEQLLSSDIEAYGGYSYIQYKLNERWEGGIRYDYTQPFTINNSAWNIQQWVPYLTWWQSHWVRLRFEYHYKYGNFVPQSDHQLFLQITFAAGPHKHERY